MLIGYARVSTDEQHLDLQLEALKAHGCQSIFCDQGVSGSCFDRVGLRDALHAVQPGDALVVWRLDRLGRSLLQLVDLIVNLNASNINVISLTECVDTNTSTGRFMFHMMAALAEFERSLIAERTKAGMMSARQRGRQLGRPVSITPEQLDYARTLLNSNSIKSVAREFHVHTQTLKRHLRRSS
ncbi:recombinase family protein [Burkholderia sp. JSH-S8]|nr:recombinase family protein [Burkholderia sp. JSH-S8]